MLRIDRAGRGLSRLATRPFAEAGMLERSDLQQMIRNAPAEFFSELREEMLPLGEEIRPSEIVDDRIDLLAVDREGTIAVVELKRGAHKLQLLQALSCAALIADWESSRFITAQFSHRNENDAEEEIEEFLNEDPSTLNTNQRVILVAEEYDFEVLATAKWLTERYKLDIACWRAELAVDGTAEYLSLSCIYPPPELAEAARTRRGPRERRPSRWADWDGALAAISNPAVVQFYRERLNEAWPSRLRRRALLFDISGRRRFWMSARARHAYVWQRGRFEGDESFWRSRLGAEARLGPVADGRALRIFLTTSSEFEAFLGAYRDDIPSKRFIHEPPSEIGPEEDEGEQEQAS